MTNVNSLTIKKLIYSTPHSLSILLTDGGNFSFFGYNPVNPLATWLNVSSEILNICDLITNIDESCYFVSTERDGSYPCADSVVFWKA